MKRRWFIALATMVLATRPRSISAWTEVKHGPNPNFDRKLTGGKFMCEVVGHYTADSDYGAGGVTVHRFDSENPENRRAELLVLRTCFLEWFLEQYQANGGSRADAISQVRYITDGWLRRPN